MSSPGKEKADYPNMHAIYPHGDKSLYSPHGDKNMFSPHGDKNMFSSHGDTRYSPHHEKGEEQDLMMSMWGGGESPYKMQEEAPEKGE